MAKPLFSICVITKNEALTFPRLINSLKEFKKIKGEICILDTGSTDNTSKVARSLGCKVKEVGDKYLLPVPNPMQINQRFVVQGEKQVVSKEDKYFNFSAARNDCASMATNDFIFWYDADEVAVKLDIDKINAFIKEGNQQFEYKFVFAYDQFGNEAMKFMQSKAYDRRAMQWMGIVHELIQPFKDQQPKRLFLGEDIYKLGHYQNQEQGRHSYLIGLAVDCFLNPKADRQSHYFARELFWNGRPKSALKEFRHHVTLGGWVQERAESFLFMGDIHAVLNEPHEQVKCFNEAFYIDSSRNTALIRLARFYQWNKNWQSAVCYARAAQEIPYTGFYADTLANYHEVPEEILYSGYGWLGNITAAQEHILKALEYQPYNPDYLRDTKYYFEYFDHQEIEGWMRFRELQFLYNKSKKYKTIVEIGSWAGRSTHALLSGNKTGSVTAVDTWEGSQDIRDSTNKMAKEKDMFEVFKNNMKDFTNLKIIRKTSIKAAKNFEDGSIDMCFIDAGHTKAEVREDILAWLPKLKSNGMICGHDYTNGVWMTVVEGVNSVFGKPDGVEDSIWWVDLSKHKKSNFSLNGTTKKSKRISKVH